MATQRLLTQLGVDKAKARPTGRYELPDGAGGVPGLALRVSEQGAKSFALRYRINGKQQRVTLGKHPIMPLVVARKAAREMLQQVERGEDPVAAKADAQRERDRNSVGTIVALYIEKRLKPRTRRWANVEAMLRYDVVANWGERPIQSITKRDVRDLTEAIVARGAPVVANRVLSHLRSMFKWAIRADYTTTNPALDIDRPHDERPRQRTLSEAEIRAVWQAFDKMAYPFGTLARLLLATGQRRGEWAGARWSEIDLERQVWTLPAGRSKTGAVNLLPLTTQVIEILATIPRFVGTDLIFPANRLGSANPISGFNAALRQAHRLSGTSGWHLHDLRRTCRTGFAKLGITAAVGERILNHSDGTRSAIAAVYDTYSYVPEMGRALQLWAAELDRIVSGTEATVIALRR